MLILYNKKCEKTQHKVSCKENFEEKLEPFEEKFDISNPNNNCKITPLICPSGGYCPASGLTSYVICPTGNYCPVLGLSDPIKCDSGYYCNTTGLTLQTQCPVGSYCPTVSGSPLPCSQGTYCPTKSIASNACTIGYYCENPTKQTPCTISNYCPTGSYTEKKCIIGSYCETPSSQVPCDNTNYCPTGSTSQIKCKGGFYCSNPSLQISCTPGTFCPTGSIEKIPCPAGSYCLAESSSTKECPAGSYCPASTGITTTCNIGNYCPPGSSTEVLCLAGSICETPSSQVYCPPGYYCSTGTSKATRCSSGYYCENGSINQKQCPNGFYCPGWTPILLNVYEDTNNPGTFTSAGGTSTWDYEQSLGTISSKESYSSSYVSFKTNTPSKKFMVGLSDINTGKSYRTIKFGFYINGETETIDIYESNTQNGLVTVTKNDTNYKSLPSIPSLTDTYLITHDGVYIRYYQNKNLLREVSYSGKLYLGNAFNSGEATITNLVFGPMSSNSVVGQILCKSGTYCPPGSFTEKPCELGYVCTTPYGQSPCSTGNYCDYGTVVEQPCPKGFYCPNPSTKNPCDKGYYCETGSISQSKCSAGYFCPDASTQTICPSGYYCPIGTTEKIVCPVGSYCPTDGMSFPSDCPTGHYCPSPTIALPCTPGTFCPTVNTCSYITTNPSSISKINGPFKLGNSENKLQFLDAGLLTSMEAYINIKSITTKNTPVQSSYILELYIDDEGTNSKITLNLNTSAFTTSGTNSVYNNTNITNFTYTINLLQSKLITLSKTFYFKNTTNDDIIDVSATGYFKTTTNQNTITII